jgi:hypothetical protein
VFVKITKTPFYMNRNYFMSPNAAIRAIVCVLIIVFCSETTSAQIYGAQTIPSANYPTIKVAIDSLNAQGVGPGGVTFDINAGHTETLTGRLSLDATGTLTNPIVFQKNGIGANPIVSAYTGVALASGTAPRWHAKLKRL